MEEQQRKDTGGRRRTMQQVSVPFLWEEKPGMPKKDWKESCLPTTPVLLLPPPPPPPPSPPPPVVPSRPPPPPPEVAAKFIVSVPFKWEEKPGTPIRSFARDPSLAPKNKSLPLPPAYYSQFMECFESEQESSFEDDDDEDEDEDDEDEDEDNYADDADDPDWLAELDASASSSAPSLLANRLVPLSSISSAIPFEKMKLEVPSSPDSDESSTSTYATRNTSPVGNSFLQQLFPLYTHKANSPSKLALDKRGFHGGGVEVEGVVPKLKSERSIVLRRPQTLEELIMLSRRRSYLHKVVGMRENSVSKEREEPNALGCCMFGAGNGGMAKILSGKSLLTLKFA